MPAHMRTAALALFDSPRTPQEVIPHPPLHNAMRTRTRAASRELSHVDREGRVSMVDISHKPDTFREAVARGRVTLAPHTLSLITRDKIPKGNVFNTARLAGIMAAKRVDCVIPLCHSLCLTHISIGFETRVRNRRARITIEARARLVGKTGVEMEVLAAVSVAALAIYDMCKTVDTSMKISEIRLVSKTGGRSDKQMQPRIRRIGRINK